MSKIEISYDYLDDAQAILNTVTKRAGEFDWNGPDGDLSHNCKIVSEIVHSYNLGFKVIYLQDEYDGNRWAIMYDDQLWLSNTQKTYYWAQIVSQDVEMECDFYSMLDVVKLINDWAKEVKELKGIKREMLRCYNEQKTKERQKNNGVE